MNLRKTLRRALSEWQLYAFLLLPLLYIILFSYVPMAGAQIAFRKYTARAGIFGSTWVGLSHFQKFIKSYQFTRVVTNTLSLSVYSIVCGFPLPILFALMMNSLRAPRFKKAAQAIVNLPHFISVVVLVGMLMQLFNARTGIYGLLSYAFTGAYPRDPFSSAVTFRHLYIWSGIWQEFGWGSIVYVAALSGVSQELHEAAQIDGATRVKRLLHVDLPGILPTITIMLILRMGNVMSIGFEKIYLMQNPLNLSASEVISTYVYSVGLSSTGKSDFSYATAIGLFNSAINLGLVVSVNQIAKRISSNSLW